MFWFLRNQPIDARSWHDSGAHLESSSPSPPGSKFTCHSYDHYQQTLKDLCTSSLANTQLNCCAGAWPVSKLRRRWDISNLSLHFAISFMLILSLGGDDCQFRHSIGQAVRWSYVRASTRSRLPDTCQGNESSDSAFSNIRCSWWERVRCWCRRGRWGSRECAARRLEREANKLERLKGVVAR